MIKLKHDWYLLPLNEAVLDRAALYLRLCSDEPRRHEQISGGRTTRDRRVMQDSKANEPYEIDVIDLCCHRVREKYNHIDSVVCYLGPDLLIPATQHHFAPVQCQEQERTPLTWFRCHPYR